MHNKFLLNYETGLIVTVGRLYDKGYSVAEIAQKLKKDEIVVRDVVIAICMVRENVRMGYI